MKSGRLVLDGLRNMYEYIVIDTPHDFSNVAIHMLNCADQMLMMLSPEMASIRSAVCALNIYDKLNYSLKKSSRCSTISFRIRG